MEVFIYDYKIKEKFKNAPMALLILLIIPVLYFLFLVIIRALWGWVIPDLFPGAVEEGMIIAELSWYTAFKLSLFLIVLGGVSSSS